MKASPARRFWIRVFAIASKELLHIGRDPRTLILALVMPVILLLLFGYGVSFDLDRLPLAVADADHSDSSRALIRAFSAGHEFEVVSVGQASEMETRLRRGEALGALLIPAGYEQALLRGQTARASLLVDGADSNSANQVIQKADALTRAEIQRQLGGPAFLATPPLELRTWTLYNPASRSAVFIVPGLNAYLLALGAVLLTALTIAAEWERGSMEQLFASPVGRFEIILGKLLPYLGIGFLQLLLVVASGAWFFEVPMQGSLIWLFLFSLVFLVGMLGQGLFISVIAKNQLVATQAGTLSAMLPSLLLSGMLFPIENMPLPLRIISELIPAKHLVHAMRGIMLKGSGLTDLWRDLLAMAVFSTLILTLATKRFKRRIA
jgi:ABC-2 type transport system permease protein